MERARSAEGDGETPVDTTTADADAGIDVAVVRTGGIAGVRREWRTHASGADRARWTSLIEKCPWDDVQPPRSRGDAGGLPPAPGADSFSWSILVDTSVARREVSLGESALTGPWRDLVDAVRASSSTSRPSRDG